MIIKNKRIKKPKLKEPYKIKLNNNSVFNLNILLLNKL